MWVLLGMLSCGGGAIDERRVAGIDVVTVEVDPPRVVIFESVSVTAWVVDSARRDPDVLVWPCTAIQIDDRIRCAEGLDVDGVGVPVSAWVRSGVITDQHATFSIPAPLLTYLAVQQQDPELLDDEGIPVPVFVMACAPGVCPIFEAVRADPAPGSDAYARLARQLADPDLLAGQGERAEVSLAVKLFHLVSDQAEEHIPPDLRPVGRRTFEDPIRYRWQWQLTPGVLPGRDEGGNPSYSTRIRYTQGGVLSNTLVNDVLTVEWLGIFGQPAGEMVVSLSDDEGGVTAVSVELPAVDR